MSATVTDIRLYPLKSAAGTSVHSAVVERWGLRGDRRWGLLDADGRRVSAVATTAVMGVRAAPVAGGALSLTAPGHPDLVVRPPVGGEKLAPASFFDVRQLTLADPDAHAWLTEVTGVPLRLVWLDDPASRPLAPEHGGMPGEVVSLADDGPLLLTSASSLRQLDDWVAAGELERGGQPPEPLAMARFRPNVVVDGFAPFVEDRWTGVRIGDVPFRITEACDRCAVTTIDPETLVSGKEPIRTLARHRRWDGKTFFGVRLAPLAEGEIRVGDAVTAAAQEPVVARAVPLE